MRHLKEEFDKLSFKETLMYALSVVSLTAGYVLLFCALLIAPRGEIHDSVLTAFGLMLVFVGTILGLDMKYDNKTSAFKRTVLELLEGLGKEAKQAQPKGATTEESENI
ncbi:MAG: hypothetical protein HDQ88_02295 [Clostridia bacterium]|nr:hypothetical protein [Clostridia bacterium]